ncbi:unnamed protein product [Orchesella dallaii]|uniref:Uncharacterized protein n=1 Tax=Orchesella dallaii TaxID=48710 RepID=A0ABP1PPS4_9HEXA
MTSVPIRVKCKNANVNVNVKMPSTRITTNLSLSLFLTVDRAVLYPDHRELHCCILMNAMTLKLSTFATMYTTTIYLVQTRLQRRGRKSKKRITDKNESVGSRVLYSQH